MGQVRLRATSDERARVRADLCRYGELAECAERMRSRAANAREQAMAPSGGRMDGMPRASGGHGLDDRVIRVVELEGRADAMLARAEAARADIVREIDALEDPRLLDLADAVFLQRMTVSDAARSLGWSVRHAWTLMSQALDALALNRRV